MSKITTFAKGRDCTVRIPGICNDNPETSVMSHVPNGLRFGKGLGKKPSDLLVAIICYECHRHVDGQTLSEYSKEYLEVSWWRGHGETLLLLEQEGIIQCKI